MKVAEHVLTKHKVAIKILNRRKIRQMDMEEKGQPKSPGSGVVQGLSRCRAPCPSLCGLAAYGALYCPGRHPEQVQHQVEEQGQPWLL